MKLRLLILAVTALFAIGVAIGATRGFQSPDSTKGAETIYVVNHAPKYISDAQIQNDIPAWEKAANEDFAPLWHTPQVQIKLVKSVPAGGIEALFVKDGPIQGALAYHTVARGVPQIVVYAGVGVFYGYNNSVSFTHELFEELADPSITITNQGYPYSDYCDVGGNCLPQSPGTIWANEVCDPVEAYAYQLAGADGAGVKISDFITPNWFNDEVKGPIDYMNYLGAPFLIAPGGYAQYWDGSEWNAVVNFRHAGKDADGFLKGESLEKSLPLH